MSAIMKNIGAFIQLLRASANAALTAGGAGDNTEVVGVTIDRLAYGSALSAVICIPFKAVLAAAATLSIGWKLYHSDAANMAGETVLTEAAAAVVATGGGGGTTEAGQVEADVSLDGAKRYIRLKFTPNLSAANTDTAECSSVIALGGQTEI